MSAIAHETFINSLADSDYPYKNIKLVAGTVKSDGNDFKWVMRPGKADSENESYVSIESENKPGLYITANADDTVTLSQDTKASKAVAVNQTFKTVVGLGDKSGVSFESVALPGNYLTFADGVLTLTDGKDKNSSTFAVKAMEQ